MNKTARIRILALCLCLLLAFAAIGAGKPVAVQRAVRSDEITTDPAQPEAPSEPETSPDEPEQVPDEPEEAPSEPEAVPDEPEAVPDEPEQAPQRPVPQLGADASDDADFDGIPDSIDSDPGSNVFTGKLKSGHDGTTTVSFTVDFRNFFGDNTIYQPDLATFSVMGAALGVAVEHELNQRELKADRVTLEEGKARPRNLRPPLEVEDVERLAQIGVVLGFEVERARRAPTAHLDVRGLVGPLRDVVVYIQGMLLGSPHILCF